jgi:O-6-methylguanine DNA methyltransferase
VSFRDRVVLAVKNIPRGKTLSYKQVAAAAGSPRAFRAVGSIMKANHDPSVPCHRVVRSDGTVGGYNRGGERRKTRILREEGALSEQQVIKQ